jgi:chaperonin GroES
MPQLEPLNDRLIVVAIEDPEVTEAGIVLPEQAREKPQRGTVVALGPDAAVQVGASDEDVPVLTVGDTIIYSKYGGAEITVEAIDYMVLRTSDILARVAIAEAPAE